MNREKHTHRPQQTRLALGDGTQWQQLPREVRDRCRDLLVQLLMDLVRSRGAGGEDER